jgi:predicted ATPase
MRLRTLGGLALEGASFTRPKPLLLLAYLAVEGAQERQHLAELFWPRAKDGPKSLTVALSQLRSGAPGAVMADFERVWTTLPCDAVDLLDGFRRGERASALEHGHDAFLEGVRLPPVGVELEEWIHGTKEFIALHVHRVRLDEAERLAANGRFDEAARRALPAIELIEVAAEPEDLARLHALLLAGDSPAAARVRREAADIGIDLAPTAEEARRRLARRSERGAPPPQSRLPRPATGLIGREAERGEVAALLGEPGARLVSLIGPAGVGKSRLALRVAHDEAARGAYVGGVAFVPLAHLRSARDILPAILDALEVPADGAHDALGKLADAIGTRKTLLVCDSLEHLIDGATALGDLVASCSELRLLVTSRERLNLANERVYTLVGLPFPQEASPEPAVAREADAVRLFVRRAHRARPSYRLTDAEVPEVVRVCRLVEGLPLGLELAASWVRVMTVREIADAIERDIDVLVSPERDAPERHRSVVAAFERSWSLLTDRERHVLRRLAVFRGGFRREAAALVADATLATLASLVDKSLIRMHEDGRYDRHPLVYQFTRRKLTERPEEAKTAADRHASYYLGLLLDARARLEGEEAKVALDAIEAERENLRAAFAELDPADTPETYAGAVETMTQAFELRSRYQEGLSFFRTVAARLTDRSEAHASARARVAVAEARLLRCLGAYDAALGAAGAALEHFRTAGDPAAQRSALQVLGVTALHLGDYGAAMQHFEEGLALLEPNDRPSEAGVAHGNLGLALQLAGDRADAIEHLRHALVAFREQGDVLREARLQNNLGLLHFEDGDHARARRCWEAGLALALRTDNQRDALSLTANLGMLHAANGDLAAAAEHDEHALRVARAVGDTQNEAAALARMAVVARRQGRHGRAEHAAKEAVEVAWRAGETSRVLECLKVLADARLARGSEEAALELYAVVREHEATTSVVRQQAADGCSRVGRTLDEDALEAAEARARTASLDGLVARVVGPAL